LLWTVGSWQKANEPYTYVGDSYSGLGYEGMTSQYEARLETQEVSVCEFYG